MNINILLVDDDPANLRKCSRKLKRELSTKNNGSINIDCADNYRQAINKLTDKFYEILVVDLVMPGSSETEFAGFEIISEFRRLDKIRSIIVISGYGTIENIKKSYHQYKVNDFIEKSGTGEDTEMLTIAVQKAIDNRYNNLLRAGNPFTLGSNSQPANFGGRTRELDFFEQKLNRAVHAQKYDNFIVQGDWGIGKSTLLREFKKIAQTRGYKVSLVTLELLPDTTSIMEAARSLVEGILRNLPYELNKLTFNKVVNFFDSIGISILGTKLIFKPNQSSPEISVQTFLHNFLSKLWEDLKDKTEILVILLDELENYMAVPEIIMNLRTVLLQINSESRILLGIATTENSWQEITSSRKFSSLDSYFISKIKIQHLSKKELTETILDSVSNTGIRFTNEIINFVFQQTNGHPFEMQILCYHLFNNQLSGVVETNIWDKALHDSLNHLKSTFDRWIKEIDEDEYHVFKTICNSNKSISKPEIMNILSSELSTTSLSFIEKQVSNLINKKLIIKEVINSNDFYSCYDKMFQTYFFTKF